MAQMTQEEGLDHRIHAGFGLHIAGARALYFKYEGLDQRPEDHHGLLRPLQHHDPLWGLVRGQPPLLQRCLPQPVDPAEGSLTAAGGVGPKPDTGSPFRELSEVRWPGPGRRAQGSSGLVRRFPDELEQPPGNLVSEVCPEAAGRLAALFLGFRLVGTAVGSDLDAGAGSPKRSRHGPPTLTGLSVANPRTSGRL